MKKYLIAIAMVLTLSLNADAAAQKHRHTPRTEQVDTTKNNRDAIEAFSDTTAVAGDSIDAYAHRQHISISADEDVKGVFEDIFQNLDKTAIAGMFFAGHVFRCYYYFHHVRPGTDTDHHRRVLLHQQEPQGPDQAGTDGDGKGTADTRRTIEGEAGSDG